MASLGAPIDDDHLFQFDDDCRRLAKSMEPEHKTTLLEIADACERVAEEREREAGTKE
jgi:hypothetical protein